MSFLLDLQFLLSLPLPVTLYVDQAGLELPGSSDLLPRVAAVCHQTLALGWF